MKHYLFLSFSIPRAISLHGVSLQKQKKKKKIQFNNKIEY